jgi:hypothetical protein
MLCGTLMHGFLANVDAALGDIKQDVSLAACNDGTPKREM